MRFGVKMVLYMLQDQITIYEMLPYQAFEIDELEDIPFMETIFRKFFL